SGSHPHIDLPPVQCISDEPVHQHPPHGGEEGRKFGPSDTPKHGAVHPTVERRVADADHEDNLEQDGGSNVNKEWISAEHYKKIRAACVADDVNQVDQAGNHSQVDATGKQDE